MRRYDTTFIIDGNLPEAERHTLIEKLAGSLKRHGAEIEQIVRWGMRSLAYAMNKRTHGYYVILYYRAEPKTIASFERDLRLNENILRYMTLLFDGKHPEYFRDEGAGEREIVIDDSVPEVAESELQPEELVNLEEELVNMEENIELAAEGDSAGPLEFEGDLEDEPVKEKENE